MNMFQLKNSQGHGRSICPLKINQASKQTNQKPNSVLGDSQEMSTKLLTKLHHIVKNGMKDYFLAL